MINIYKITDKTNNKIYIGQTKRDIMKRYAEHISHAFTSKRKNDLACTLYIAMRNHGVSNFEIELLETIEGDNMKDGDNAEIKWISFYDSANPDKGYNIDKGGHIISEACRLAAEKYLFKAGAKLEGKFLENARNNGAKAAKPILQLNKLTREVIAEFPSIIEASRQTGCDRRSIQKQLNGETKLNTNRGFSCAKFIWVYKLT